MRGREVTLRLLPLDEAPTLVALQLAVARRGVDELYRRLAEAGYADLEPASAVIFQHIRPGGSSPEELAELGGVTPAAVEEQTRALWRG